MSDVVGMNGAVIKTLSRYHAMPSQAKIAKRLKNRFGAEFPWVGSLINMAAEECERIILELTRPHFEPDGTMSVKIIKAFAVGKKTRFRISGYVCPSCRYNEVHTDHRHCPGCGLQINWITPVSNR